MEPRVLSIHAKCYEQATDSQFGITGNRRQQLIMKKLVLIVMAGLVIANQAIAGTENTITWSPTYANAQKQALGAHKLVLIDFVTDWCVWCHVMDQKV